MTNNKINCSAITCIYIYNLFFCLFAMLGFERKKF